MDFRVLGPLEVSESDRTLRLGGFRQRLVLGVLLLHANRTVTTDWLIDAVWGEDPPRTARKTLQAYVARLRGLLGPSRITPGPAGYALHVGADELDSERFEHLAAEGHRMLGTDPLMAAGMLRRALAPWRGMPWGDLGDEPAIQPEAQRLIELRRNTLEDRIAADLETGHAAALVGELEGLVEEYPLRESFRAQLMLALYRCGRQSEALRSYQVGRRVLGEELGIEPSRDLQVLEEQILLHDPAISGPPPHAGLDDMTVARNPYKGLRAFGPEDTSDFFGRDDLVDRLADRVGGQRLTALVGASGSGKSSVVMAGLIPRLSSGEWTVVTMVPGRDPFTGLEAALPGARREGDADEASRGDALDLLRTAQHLVSADGERLLLIIDQFEELFHQVDDAALRARFVRNLVEAIEDPSGPLTLLVVLRADYLDRAMALPEIGELIGNGMVAVHPMRTHQLEAAAARPAEGAGVFLEPELVAQLVGDMAGQPGALPLFEYVLTLLFEQRRGPVLTRAAYRKLGGLDGALSRRAEVTFTELDAASQTIAHQLFMRLVTVKATGEAGRRRVETASLDALEPGGHDVKVVLDAFAEARLLTFDSSPTSGQATVEVAHEALLSEWPRMRSWVDAARDDLRLHDALSAEVAEWEASGRNADFLPAGSRLARYDDWAATTGLGLIPAEREFLAAGGAKRQAERDREHAQRDEQIRLGRRSVRRLRALVAVISIAALVAAGLTLFAVNRGRAAAASQREARARELANAAMANADNDPELAILLALEAIDTTRRSDGFVAREAVEALHMGVGAHRIVASASGRWDAAFGPQGDLVVAGNPVRVIDPGAGTTRLELAAPNAERDVEAIAVSNDGTLIAAGTTGDGWVGVFDSGTGDEVIRLGPVGDTVGALEFSRDDRLLAALAPGPGKLDVWEVASGQRVASRIDPWARPVFGPKEDISFDDGGTRLAMTAGDEVWVLDIATSRWTVELIGHDSLTTSVGFVPGSDVVATGSTDGTIRLWDAATGEELAAMDAGVGQVVSLAVDRDGGRFLAGGDTGAVRLGELLPAGPRVITNLFGVRSMVTSLAFDQSGDGAAAVGLEGEVIVWDSSAAGPGEVMAWSAEGPVSFSADGQRIAFGGADGRSVVMAGSGDWEPTTLIEDVVPYVGPETFGFGSEWGELGGLAHSPDGAVIATVTYGYEVVPGALELWSAATGDPVRRLASDLGLSGALAIAGDGWSLAAGFCGPGGRVRVWDIATGGVVFDAPTGSCVRSVDLGADDRLVAVQTEAFGEPNVHVWDTVTDEPVLEVTHRPAWRGGVAFSPAGDRLLTAGGDGSLRIWDLETGRLLVLLEGHTGPVEGAVWSADGGTIVSAGLDATVRLWDADTGAEELTLTEFVGRPSASLSPDGRWLATAAGGVVKIWAIDLDELIEIARGRLTRSISAAECATYHFDSCPALP